MTSITQHLGKGANTSISSIPLSGSLSTGKLSTCIGARTENVNIDWYTYKTPVGPILNLCEYCARTAFKESEVEKTSSLETCSSFSPRQHRGYSGSLGSYRKICDFASRPHDDLYRLGCYKRAMFYHGLRVNVNVIDQSGKQFRPTSLLPGTEAAVRDGTGIFQVPSHRYYEICVTGQNLRNTADFILLEDGYFENGKKIRLLDQNGCRYLTNVESGMIINSFTSGDSSSRFVFVAPSDEEKGAGLEAECHNKSNIIHMEIGLYKKAPEEMHFRSATLTRGGSGITRGGGGHYRGAPSGGSTLAGEGTSTTASTRKIKPPIKIGVINFTIQLVSTQDNNERLNLAQGVQKDVELAREQEIANLQAKMEELQRASDTDSRAKLTQRSHLLNLN
jgi:hypothetical protein